MGKELSIFIASRISGNKNSRLKRVIESILDNSRDKERVEILIKFDKDDKELSSILPWLNKFKGIIKYIITDRCAGYADLHKAYNDLLLLCSSESKVYTVFSDDIEILKKNWDEYVLSYHDKYKDNLYVLHTMPLISHRKLSVEKIINMPDPYPFWSSKWIKIMGGFGFTYSTDGWSALIEHYLISEYGCDRRIYLHDKLIKRYVCDDDKPGSERYKSIRKETIDILQTDQAIALAKHLAGNLYLNINKNDENHLKMLQEMKINYMVEEAYSYKKLLSNLIKFYWLRK